MLTEALPTRTKFQKEDKFRNKATVSGISPSYPLIPFPGPKVLHQEQTHRQWLSLSDYGASDFKRNPMERENSSLFKHAFQRKRTSP